jgi:threonine synthase
VNHPTLSFKDRVVAVAVIKALEFVPCRLRPREPGRLGGGPRAGGAHQLVHPHDWSRASGHLHHAPNVVADGTYDEVNRL